MSNNKYNSATLVCRIYNIVKYYDRTNQKNYCQSCYSLLFLPREFTTRMNTELKRLSYTLTIIVIEQISNVHCSLYLGFSNFVVTIATCKINEIFDGFLFLRGVVGLIRKMAPHDLY